MTMGVQSLTQTRLS